MVKKILQEEEVLPSDLLNDEPDSFHVHLDTLLDNLRNYFHAVLQFPRTTIYYARRIIHILSSWDEFKRTVVETWDHLSKTPLIVFYGYLWRNRKSHFFLNLFTSYAMPIILESMPWYFSRFKIGRKLRELKNKIHNRMIAGNTLDLTHARTYTLLTLLYSLLENLDKHINTRVSLMNRLLVKRLVLERILYSEIWSFNEYHGRELEIRISTEIQSTLKMFSFTIPNTLGSFYAIYKEAKDLYLQRNRIDVLAIARPFVVMAIFKVVDWTKRQVLGTKTITHNTSNPHVSQLFSNAVDGLVDIQLNNLQQVQMQHYDQIISNEFSASEDLRLFTNRIYNTFTKRGVFDFLSDNYIAALVMDKRDMNYEQYRKIQIDIDHLTKLVRKALNYLWQISKVIERSSRVVELMQLPNFKHEDLILPIKTSHFQELTISQIEFTYSRKNRPPYALQFDDTITFLPNKVYGIIGQNRSGKSTLVNLITKLYVPQKGTITWNGVSYANIQRSSLRDMIAYVAQKPFIFPGTIAENIKMARLDATDDDLINAAEMAGIFLYDECKQSTTKKRSNSKIESYDPSSSSTISQSDSIIVEEKKELTDSEMEEKSIKRKLRKRKRQLKILNGKTMARGSNLSGGFSQSVALARIFLKLESKIIILDESLSAMDPIKKRQVIFPNLLNFVKQKGVTLIMITHDMQNMELYDHMIMLETGKIVCQGSHEELLDSRNFKYLQMLGVNVSSL
ncbi:ABC transporter H family member [Acrasis kona]|uniref:ABC transporter H family member n=1 Tax=Acrasis kona TaxID=1008807 RepID=A0AAW2YTV9_9EUKA